MLPRLANGSTTEREPHPDFDTHCAPVGMRIDRTAFPNPIHPTNVESLSVDLGDPCCYQSAGTRGHSDMGRNNEPSCRARGGRPDALVLYTDLLA